MLCENCSLRLCRICQIRHLILLTNLHDSLLWFIYTLLSKQTAYNIVNTTILNLFSKIKLTRIFLDGLYQEFKIIQGPFGSKF